VVQADCNLSGPPTANSYVYAYDFGNTTRGGFSLSMWYNNTNDLNTTQGPPLAQRVNQVNTKSVKASALPCVQTNDCCAGPRTSLS
jgi:hypothetical protein